MIIFELTANEAHPVYQQLEVANGVQQYDFLRSMVVTALSAQQAWLSQQVIKALNYHAIACLHTNPGEFRPCPVHVGDYMPPQHYQVPAQMEQFVDMVNASWSSQDAVVLASYVLWRLNYIHPFINGNGRTARAAAYFVLCVKTGGLLPGSKILPELLRENRDEYVAALKAADSSIKTGQLDLSVLHALLTRLIREQIATAEAPPQN